MKTTELRIGNKATFLDRIVTIEAIAGDIVSVSGFERNLTNVYQNHKGLKPIKISTEVLMKCDFDTEFGVLRFHRNDMPLDLFKYHNSDEYWFVKSSSGDKITTVKHLHQLQNLYFALTGEELEINL